MKQTCRELAAYLLEGLQYAPKHRLTDFFRRMGGLCGRMPRVALGLVPPLRVQVWEGFRAESGWRLLWVGTTLTGARAASGGANPPNACFSMGDTGRQDGRRCAGRWARSGRKAAHVAKGVSAAFAQRATRRLRNCSRAALRWAERSCKPSDGVHTAQQRVLSFSAHLRKAASVEKSHKREASFISPHPE